MGSSAGCQAAKTPGVTPLRPPRQRAWSVCCVPELRWGWRDTSPSPSASLPCPSHSPPIHLPFPPRLLTPPVDELSNCRIMSTNCSLHSRTDAVSKTIGPRPPFAPRCSGLRWRVSVVASVSDGLPGPRAPFNNSAPLGGMVWYGTGLGDVQDTRAAPDPADRQLGNREPSPDHQQVRRNVVGSWGGGGGGGQQGEATESRLASGYKYMHKARSTCTKRVILLFPVVWCSDSPPIHPSPVLHTPTATVT